MPIYEAIFAVALVVSAFLALHLDETIYAIISFAAALTLLSGLYFLMNAPFAAVFQLIVAVGAVAVFFLASEMIAPKKGLSQKMRDKILGLLIASFLAAIPFLVDLNVKAFSKPHNLSFASALWEYRALDIVAQSIVVLTLAIGIVMVLKGRRGK
ncbi:TPA: hypothetical protein EYP75_02945 [Candidatus Bathyarchaeota archaeon]|nr:hypothetical protein [Candidatus Bathyarchaeota archaeon]